MLEGDGISYSLLSMAQIQTSSFKQCPSVWAAILNPVPESFARIMLESFVCLHWTYLLGIQWKAAIKSVIDIGQFVCSRVNHGCPIHLELP